MLVRTVKQDDRVFINHGQFVVTMAQTGRGRCKIGIDGPKSVPIYPENVFEVRTTPLPVEVVNEVDWQLAESIVSSLSKEDAIELLLQQLSKHRYDQTVNDFRRRFLEPCQLT